MPTITQNVSGIQEEIRNANDRFERFFVDRDAAGMASLYTNDGMLLPPGADVQSGKQAIQAFWQMVMDMGVKTALLETLEVEDNGEIAIEVGRYNLRGAEGQVIDHGKYIVAWKKDMGQWKLSRDIWNTSIVS